MSIDYALERIRFRVNLTLIVVPSLAVALQTHPELNSPLSLTTRPIQEREHLRFIEQTVPKFFESQSYTFTWSNEPERTAQLRSPERQIVEGPDRGAFERVTFLVQIFEVREPHHCFRLAGLFDSRLLPFDVFVAVPSPPSHGGGTCSGSGHAMSGKRAGP